MEIGFSTSKCHHNYLLKHDCSFPFSSPRQKPFSSLTLWASVTFSNQGCNQPGPGSSNVPTLKLTGASVPCPVRRKLNVSLIGLTLILNGSRPIWSRAAILAEEELKLERYTDPQQGFTLLKPPSYSKVDKAGATVLFEEMKKASNNVGVVVTPVRLNTLTEFGTPEFVADKLIQAEKRKESTKQAEIIWVRERSGGGSLPVYEFEYKVDSTRGGLKRIFTAAFVSSKKLYLLNVVHSDNPENPLDGRTRVMLEEVLHSFDLAPVT